MCCKPMFGVALNYLLRVSALQHDCFDFTSMNDHKYLSFLTDCGQIAITHGRLDTSATNYGTIVTVQCNDGYSMVGNAAIHCLPDGTWTQIPSCRQISESYLNFLLKRTSVHHTAYSLIHAMPLSILIFNQ